MARTERDSRGAYPVVLEAIGQIVGELVNSIVENGESVEGGSERNDKATAELPLAMPGEQSASEGAEAEHRKQRASELQGNFTPWFGGAGEGEKRQRDR